MSASHDLTKKKECRVSSNSSIMKIVCDHHPYYYFSIRYIYNYVLGDVSNRGGGTNPANSRRSLGLAASAKILTRAANWRAKSLQAVAEALGGAQV